MREAKNALEYMATIAGACVVDCANKQTREDSGDNSGDEPDDGSGSETRSESAEQLQRDLQFWR